MEPGAEGYPLAGFQTSEQSSLQRQPDRNFANRVRLGWRAAQQKAAPRVLHGLVISVCATGADHEPNRLPLQRTKLSYYDNRAPWAPAPSGNEEHQQGASWFGCRACAANGQAAAPPSSVMFRIVGGTR